MNTPRVPVVHRPMRYQVQGSVMRGLPSCQRNHVAQPHTSCGVAQPADLTPSSPRFHLAVISGAHRRVMKLSRRQLLAASTVAGASLAVPGVTANAAPNLVRRDRAALPSGVASADVTANSAVVWSRADRPGRLIVELTSHGRFDRAISLRGPKTDAGDDFTARMALRGLRPGQRYDYRLGFEDADGRIGQTLD